MAGNGIGRADRVPCTRETTLPVPGWSKQVDEPESNNSPGISQRDRKTYIAVATVIIIITILQVFILF
jgi:hypothetical protein